MNSSTPEGNSSRSGFGVLATCFGMLASGVEGGAAGSALLPFVLEEATDGSGCCGATRLEARLRIGEEMVSAFVDITE